MSGPPYGTLRERLGQRICRRFGHRFRHVEPGVRYCPVCRSTFYATSHDFMRHLSTAPQEQGE